MRRIRAKAGVELLLALKEAADLVIGGGVVAFPTDTLYGLAVNPFDAIAVTRLFEVKGRAGAQAVALVAADVDQVSTWIAPLAGSARRLADAFWPGPLTLLLRPTARPKPSGVSNSSYLALAPGVVALDGTVGVRVPAHAIATGLCREAGRPLTATSANLSGDAATSDPDVVWRTLGHRIDLLLDGGMAPGGPPSTIVDVTSPELRLVRAGAIDWDTIQQCVSRK